MRGTVRGNSFAAQATLFLRDAMRGSFLNSCREGRGAFFLLFFLDYRAPRRARQKCELL